MSQLSPRLKSVLLAGGGTAGHISPLLATADALRRRYPDVRITVLGSHGGLEETLVPERGYDLRLIDKVAFPRRPDADAARFPLKFVRARRDAAAIVQEVGAEVVVGFGGYVSPPAFLAARKLGVPIVVHDGNALAGLATKLGSRFSPYVATAFSVTKLPHAQVVGMPLRREITTLDRAALRPEALETFGLRGHLPTVLVTGGSSGAVRVNEPVAAAADAFRRAGVQVLHVTGKGKEVHVPTGGPNEGGAPAKYSGERSGGETSWGADPAYVVLPYADRMDLAYAAADLVVTRAGGNMVCETSTIGLPAVFVPLPVGNGEQRLNASDVVDAGGALLVDNDDFTTDYLAQQVIPLVKDRERLDRMAEIARAQGHGDADEKLVDMIERAARAG
ncbi:UDP-N-acetylglucosamine--N-acetylmuramyl-(pentapeptide) pyrophosphoryl-undecaprenol N-acetylglucosamine transferase [Flexivirga endophytica]|uniref:UDP-N-acetylglucosamine--N-acetylmuramyl-(pentapeptide) pyrophosphoryl-undecaprenol N-acetylglucosamine transferase n=1 Tax=Flexivirga endophytica TaxID=1849103 RepID=A0A916SVQ4_9MICO|nr:UDP-N-acetylglucosamine--N-acetylmuramyl-(pentapeptide) pyrophosphoryl-undecaprenol N-acetylglucosamine transferase [Flexivirga endophytica]GGB18188.1 UDP-N-acetylglucosamine--N-acetylmuramyl-(pentapeptide) pyrophosphoryl-undecaprenol N-acetylglucosamine transferase [Flexivirga endophytica]GHB37430.1 UDP-N-acetylglucosamine--N-acetylmuramyl-(pentapeptide) pyrophosphoryl-undecaprenol N-acetylglucosamine transferase [Flexivirga endophytica]